MIRPTDERNQTTLWPPAATLNRTLISPQLVLKMAADRWPFAVDDAEDDGVAIAAVGHSLMITEHAILLCAEARDRRPRRLVQPVGAELDRNAGELLERVPEQQ